MSVGAYVFFLPTRSSIPAKDHIFGVHTKKPPFFFWCSHRMTPFFRRNLTPKAPYICSPVGTCTSLSYLSAPPPSKMMMLSRSRPLYLMTSILIIHFKLLLLKYNMHTLIGEKRTFVVNYVRKMSQDCAKGPEFRPPSIRHKGIKINKHNKYQKVIGNTSEGKKQGDYKFHIIYVCENLQCMTVEFGTLDIVVNFAHIYGFLPSFLQVLTSLGDYKRTAVAGVCKN